MVLDSVERMHIYAQGLYLLQSLRPIQPMSGCTVELVHQWDYVFCVTH